MHSFLLTPETSVRALSLLLPVDEEERSVRVALETSRCAVSIELHGGCWKDKYS